MEKKQTTIIPNRIDMGRIQNYQLNSDAAFIEMARKIDNENGRKMSYAMLSDGAYHVY